MVNQPKNCQQYNILFLPTDCWQKHTAGSIYNGSVMPAFTKPMLLENKTWLTCDQMRLPHLTHLWRGWDWLTWLAKSSETSVRSCGSLKMWRMTCSIGVTPSHSPGTGLTPHSTQNRSLQRHSCQPIISWLVWERRNKTQRNRSKSHKIHKCYKC